MDYLPNCKNVSHDFDSTFLIVLNMKISKRRENIVILIKTLLSPMLDYNDALLPFRVARYQQVNDPKISEKKRFNLQTYITAPLLMWVCPFILLLLKKPKELPCV